MTSTDLATTNAPAVPTVGEKALNATQLKTLQAIVDLDYKDLKQRLANQIAQNKSRRTTEITDSMTKDDEKLDVLKQALHAEVVKANEAFNAKVLKMIERAGFVVESGAALTSVSLSSQHVKNSSTIEANRKMKAIEAAAQRLHSEVMTTVDREFRKTTRTVLLQGVTTQGAAEILGDMPNPEDIMTIIQSSAELTHGDDIALLMGETQEVE